MAGRRSGIAAVAVLLAATGAAAQSPPSLPGIGATDPRVEVDAGEAPWRSLGKLQMTAGAVRSVCTATVVAPDKILTAAHCLYNRRTGAYFQASAMHVLLAYARGQHQAHGRVASFVTGAGFNPAEPDRSRGSDWAVLTLEAADRMPDVALPICQALSSPGLPVAIGGYSQDRGFTITADRDCRIVAMATDAGGRPLLRHDCAATRGVSGAPVLVHENGQWCVAGINVAAARDGPGGIATTVGDARKAF